MREVTSPIDERQERVKLAQEKREFEVFGLTYNNPQIILLFNQLIPCKVGKPKFQLNNVPSKQFCPPY